MLDWLLGLFPENVSTYGAEIDGVISTTTWIVFVWWIAAELLLFGFLFIFRKKKGGKAAYIQGDTWKAMSWVLVPTFFVFLFDIYIDINSQRVWDKVKVNLPEPYVVTQVNAMQFSWFYKHPGKDNKFGTGDDIETDVLVVPVNKVVHVEITSTDVLHSFFLPHLRFKQDAVPGRKITGWFEATKTGIYPVACAELCGTGHGIMASSMEVMTQENYEKWVHENTPEMTVADASNVADEIPSAAIVEGDVIESDGEIQGDEDIVEKVEEDDESPYTGSNEEDN